MAGVAWTEKSIGDDVDEYCRKTTGVVFTVFTFDDASVGTWCCIGFIVYG